jgi:hypothetical protein
MNTLRVKVPRSDKNYGISLGDSLQRWYQAYYLVQKSGLNCKIILQEQDWPELNFISLPITETRKTDITKNAQKIDLDCVIKLLVDNDYSVLKDYDNWYIEDWFFFNNIFEYYIDDNLINEKLYFYKDIQKDYLNLVRFNDNEINDFFDEQFSDIISLHFERDFDIRITQYDVMSFPDDVRMKFYKDYLTKRVQYRGVKENIYYPNFISDIEYYGIIEECLEYEINQNFYISTSSQIEFFQNYKERYRNIKNKFDYIDIFLKLLVEKYGKNSIKDLTVIYRLFDLFVLLKSKLVVQPHSSPFAKFSTQNENARELILPVKYGKYKSKSIRKVYNGKFKYAELNILENFT